MAGAYLGLQVPKPGNTDPAASDSPVGDTATSDTAASGAAASGAALGAAAGASLQQPDLAPPAPANNNQPAPANPVASTTATTGSGSNRATAHTALLVAGKTDPQQAVEAHALSLRFNLPFDLSLRNVDQLKHQAALDDAQFLLQDRPALTRQMAFPAFATQSIDDLPALSAIEGGIQQFKQPSFSLASTPAATPAETDSLGDDLGAAGKNFLKGLVSDAGDALQGAAVMGQSILNPNHVDAYQRIIAGDPSYAWHLQSINGQQTLVVQDRQRGGRLGPAKQYFHPGDDLYEFTVNWTPQQRAAALDAEQRKIDPSGWKLYQWGADTNDWAKQALPTTAAQDQAFLTGKLPRFLGQATGFVGVTAATGGVGGIGAGTIAGAGLAAADSAGATYNDARAHGADPYTAMKAADANATVAGSIGLIPGIGQVESSLARVLQPAAPYIGKIATKTLQKLLPTATTGLVLGGTQQAASTAIARHYYDPTRSWRDEIHDGSLTGAVANIVTRLLFGGHAIPAGPAPRPGVSSTEVSPIEPATVTGKATTSDSSSPPVTATSETPAADQARADRPIATAKPATESAAPPETPKAETSPGEVSAAASRPSQQPAQETSRPASLQVTQPHVEAEASTNAAVPSPAKSSEHTAPSTPDETVSPKAAGEETSAKATVAAENSATPVTETPTAARAQLSPADEMRVQRAANATHAILQMLAGTAGSKMRQRDGTLFEGSVADMAAHHQLDAVHIPAIALWNYMTRYMDPAGRALISNLPSVHDRLDTIGQREGTIAVPLPEFLQAAGGNDAAAHLALAARPSSTEPSLAELAVALSNARPPAAATPQETMREATYPTPSGIATDEAMAAQPWLDRATASARQVEQHPRKNVTAVGEVDGVQLFDTNQTLRDPVAADPAQPTSVSDRAIARSAKLGRPTPNEHMGNAHAELGVMEQFKARSLAKGRDLKLTVIGRDVCGFCKGDLAAAAERMGFRSVIIDNYDENNYHNVYIWKPGDSSFEPVSQEKVPQ